MIFSTVDFLESLLKIISGNENEKEKARDDLAQLDPEIWT